MKEEYVDNTLELLNSEHVAGRLKNARILNFKAERIPHRKTQIKITITTDRNFTPLLKISDILNLCGLNRDSLNAIKNPRYEGYDPKFNLSKLEFLINLKTGGADYEV